VEIEEGRRAVGIKAVSIGEPFFAGHFPGQPLVPGVLIAEAMAQLSGLIGPGKFPHGKLVHVDVRFDKPVSPPAQSVLRSRVLRCVGELQQFEVSALVEEVTVARGMLALSRPRPATNLDAPV